MGFGAVVVVVSVMSREHPEYLVGRRDLQEEKNEVSGCSGQHHRRA